jgi:ABC-2 type transport system ATP-binding protein
MSEAVIWINQLNKAYHTVVAVDQVSFQINRGEIFGLLGPNGAGKTTIIRILMDIIKPDEGMVRVLDHPPGKMRRRIGYLPEERGLYRELSVTECLTYLGQLKGLSGAAAKKRTAELLARIDLAAWEHRKVKELSRGMHQKVQLIASIIHDPGLVILDEPFQGLDPVNVVLVKDLIRELQAAGKTVILSTHQLNHVEVLCERLALINQGRIVLYGTLADIKKQFAPNAIEISPPLSLDGWAEVSHVELRDDKQIIHLVDGVTSRDFLKKTLALDLPLEQFEMATMSLEQIFVAVVKEEPDD